MTPLFSSSRAHCINNTNQSTCRGNCGHRLVCQPPNESSHNRALNPFLATSLPSSLSNSSSADAASAGTSAAPSGHSYLNSSVAGTSAAQSGPSHLNSSVAEPSHPPPDCNVINSSEIAARFSSMEGQLGKVLAELEDIKKSLAKKNFLQKGSPKEVTAEYIITLYLY